MTSTPRLRPYAGREIAPFTAADLILKPGAEPVVPDVTLADRLGFQRPTSIRVLIKRNRDEIEGFGTLHQADAKSCGGRPAASFLLNRQQAILVTILAKTSIAAKVRKQMVEVFDAVMTTQDGPGAVADLRSPSAGNGVALKEVRAFLDRIDGVLEGLGAKNRDLRDRELRLLEWEGRQKSGASSAAERAAGLDPMGAFLVGVTISDPAGKVPARTLYRLWSDFTVRHALPLESEKRFAGAMRQRLGVPQRAIIDGHDCVAYQGVRLFGCDPFPAVPAPEAVDGEMLYGVAAVADCLGVTGHAARHLVRSHNLPVFRIGRRVVALRGDVCKWLDSQRRAAA